MHSSTPRGFGIILFSFLIAQPALVDLAHSAENTPKWSFKTSSENLFTTNALDQKKARKDYFIEPEASLSLGFKLDDRFSCGLKAGTSHERHEEFSSESEDIAFFEQAGHF